MGKTVEINFSDSASVREAIAKYGDLDYPLCATNQDGEEQLISISPDGIIVRTTQHNGWVRVNEYDADGYMVGEYFDGKQG